MKRSLAIFKAGCWSFILLGLGHLATSLFAPKTSEQAMFIQTMKGFAISMPGTESNVYLFHEGFSLMMGMLLMAFGILNLLMLQNRSQGERVARNVLVFNMLVALVSLVLSVKYFFIVPVAFTSIAFLCFAVAFWLNQRMSGHVDALKEA